ncbi:pancreatic polypeptide prohormone-like [Ascaphus truei]|uniref:pancreatic polypeptide prohormone-like n=1 Tax=Ascaphus truei TaxID=8439 RepID=UPI003F5AC839
MPSTLHRLSLLLLLLLAFGAVCAAAPSEPQHPGEQATPQQLAEYYSDLWQYITFITRPRFGKRWNEIQIENSASS